MNTNEIISKINYAKLQSQEDLQAIEQLLEVQDDAFIEPLFQLLEKYPSFNFGNPGRVIHYLEKFADEVYTPYLYSSVRREPTEYNVWMVNRLLNSLEDSEKAEGIAVLEETLQKDIEEGLKQMVNEFIEDQKEE